MKNIEINYKSETSYEVLYPKTTTENLIDFAEKLYTKAEIDEMVGAWEVKINSLVAVNEYIGTTEGQSSLEYGEWNQIEVGFSPKGVLISCDDTNYNQFHPYFPTTSYSTTSFGFGPGFWDSSVALMELTVTGFRVRGRYNDPILNRKGTTYYYAAFG